MIQPTIQIYPAHKVKVDAGNERLLVCRKNHDGTLQIIGLKKYLRKGLPPIKGRGDTKVPVAPMAT